MTEETKDIVKALIEGFSNVIDDRIKIRNTELENRLLDEMRKQTDTLLEVLNKYEHQAEKHQKIFEYIKKEMSE